MIWLFAAAVIAVLFMLVRITKGHGNVPDTAPKPVPSGNASVFMDKKGNLHIIPFSVDKLKRGRASEIPVTLDAPYTPEEAGDIVRKCLGLSGSGKSLSSEELMKSLGYHDWKGYSKEKKSVSVMCMNGEVILNSTIRRPDGLFIFRTNGYERVLPGNISDSDLGGAVLELMKLSR